MDLYAIRIKELRKESNLTLTALAKKLGVSHVAIFKWENGTSQPNIQSIAMMCNLFNVTSDYLLGLETEDGTKTYNNFNGTVSGNGNTIQIGNHNKK
jgi:transcriptional regulator with XRE-family HTH domain